MRSHGMYLGSLVLGLGLVLALLKIHYRKAKGCACKPECSRASPVVLVRLEDQGRSNLMRRFTTI